MNTNQRINVVPPRTFRRGLKGFFLIFSMACAVQVSRATDNFSIDWGTIGSGGGASSDGTTEVAGTIGQFGAGEIGDNNSSIQSGFWNYTMIDGAVVITWAGGDSFVWQINKANGTAGGNPGWTLTNIVGTLQITAEMLNKFAIQLQSLNSSQLPGEAENWLNTSSYTWPIANASYGISGFNANKFSLVTNNFVNGGRGGTFSIEQSANSLLLRFNPLRAVADSALRPDGSGTKLNVLANDLLNGGIASILSLDATSAAGGALSRSGGFVFYTPPISNPASDTFSYTVSDGAGHTDVGTVTITIRPPDNTQSQNIISFSGTPGNFTVNFAGIPGRQYRFQYATAVTGPWFNIETVTAGNNGLFSVTDTVDRGPQAYYRTTAP